MLKTNPRLPATTTSHQPVRRDSAELQGKTCTELREAILLSGFTSHSQRWCAFYRATAPRPVKNFPTTINPKLIVETWNLLSWRTDQAVPTGNRYGKCDPAILINKILLWNSLMKRWRVTIMSKTDRKSEEEIRREARNWKCLDASSPSIFWDCIVGICGEYRSSASS